MSKLTPRKSGARKTEKAADTPETEAAFALLGRAFVRLIRSDRSRAGVEQAAALKLAAWLFEHRLTKAEQNRFRMDTGWLFDSDLAADDPLRRAADDPTAN